MRTHRRLHINTRQVVLAAPMRIPDGRDFSVLVPGRDRPVRIRAVKTRVAGRAFAGGLPTAI